MFKCYYEIEKLGGKKNWKSRRYLSRSFVKAFLVIIYAWLSDLAGTTLRTDNVSSNIAVGSLFVNVGGGAGGAFAYVGAGDDAANDYHSDDKLGIVVGTGNTAVTAVDYALQTKVAHGTSSGKLEHLGGLVSVVTKSNPDASFYFERIFRNASGGTITINEIGVYVPNRDGGATAPPFCILRDVITPVAVLNGEYLKVKYTIKVTV